MLSADLLDLITLDGDQLGKTLSETLEGQNRGQHDAFARLFRTLEKEFHDRDERHVQIDPCVG